MDDTLFIQFFGRTSSGWFDLCNGFSDTWDLCASQGDLYWVEQLADPAQWYDESAYGEVCLPITKGKVFVSASYVNHLYQAYTWALAYPDITFVVGGPVASERSCDRPGWHSVHFKVTGDLPPNLTLTGQSVESWFGRPEFSGTWKLEIPDVVPPKSRVYFSYTLENLCYWKKCPFCSIAQHSPAHARHRKKFGLEFKDLTYNGHKIVRLNTGSITPAQIRELLPRLPQGEDIEYRYFMRANRAETRALQEVVATLDGQIPASTLGFGIEFPSDRMWKYLNKGTRMDEVMETIDFCRESGFKVNANVILGWNNLVPQDLKDLEFFMENLSENAVTTLQLRWLFAHPYTRIYEEYQGKENSITLGPFNCGFNVRVDDRQRELNRAAAEIIREKCQEKKITLQGYNNLKKGNL